MAALGKVLAEHQEHLMAAGAFLASGWSERQPRLCPTCGAKHEEALDELVRRQTDDLDEQIGALRGTWATLRAELRTLRARLAAGATAPCPLDPEQQRVASESLAWLLPEMVDLPTLLSDPARAEELLGVVRALATPPEPLAMAAPEEREAAARAAIDAIEREQRDAAAIFELPARWQVIRKRVQEDLTTVLREHLPRTVEALWLELARNLHPAPWQLPSLPRLRLGRRGTRAEATIRLGRGARSPLAEYVLNSAESHSLGLAWFLTRHLTRGRFRHALLAMDDPVRSMDGPTFRDLCRLLAALLRLNRRLNRPLVLLLLMHDDQRALAAAQATGARVHVLGWSSGHARLVRSLRVIPDSLECRQPAEALAPTAGAAGAEPSG